jgi:hypothetical protein
VWGVSRAAAKWPGHATVAGEPRLCSAYPWNHPSRNVAPVKGPGIQPGGRRAELAERKPHATLRDVGDRALCQGMTAFTGRSGWVDPPVSLGYPEPQMLEDARRSRDLRSVR